MHIGHTISAMFAESGKKKVDFADRYYKNILAVYRQMEKPHMNTHIVCQYADFFGVTASSIIARAEKFGLKKIECGDEE